ncbi:hypothetical protein [Sphingobacterium sp. SYP-B4668]|uniref:hypothetical protein n=1 Tax=Sphingobacterium sp. SYP-B4668 TaxID=2996035 RepID=UPI0022DD8DE2|nr:hypothetical protein [Sphingobacterium sp. SYP-B4668]
MIKFSEGIIDDAQNSRTPSFVRYAVRLGSLDLNSQVVFLRDSYRYTGSFTRLFPNCQLPASVLNLCGNSFLMRELNTNLQTCGK